LYSTTYILVSLSKKRFLIVLQGRIRELKLKSLRTVATCLWHASVDPTPGSFQTQRKARICSHGVKELGSTFVTYFGHPER
jgi:hypothetical protein